MENKLNPTRQRKFLIVVSTSVIVLTCELNFVNAQSAATIRELFDIPGSSSTNDLLSQVTKTTENVEQIVEDLLCIFGDGFDCPDPSRMSVLWNQYQHGNELHQVDVTEEAILSIVSITTESVSDFLRAELKSATGERKLAAIVCIGLRGVYSLGLENSLHGIVGDQQIHDRCRTWAAVALAQIGASPSNSVKAIGKYLAQTLEKCKHKIEAGFDPVEIAPRVTDDEFLVAVVLTNCLASFGEYSKEELKKNLTVADFPKHIFVDYEVFVIAKFENGILSGLFSKAIQDPSENIVSWGSPAYYRNVIALNAISGMNEAPSGIGVDLVDLLSKRLENWPTEDSDDLIEEVAMISAAISSVFSGRHNLVLDRQIDQRFSLTKLHSAKTRKIVSCFVEIAKLNLSGEQPPLSVETIDVLANGIREIHETYPGLMPSVLESIYRAEIYDERLQHTFELTARRMSNSQTPDFAYLAWWSAAECGSSHAREQIRTNLSDYLRLVPHSASLREFVATLFSSLDNDALVQVLCHAWKIRHEPNARIMPRQFGPSIQRSYEGQWIRNQPISEFWDHEIRKQQEVIQNISIRLVRSSSIEDQLNGIKILSLVADSFKGDFETTLRQKLRKANETELPVIVRVLAQSGMSIPESLVMHLSTSSSLEVRLQYIRWVANQDEVSKYRILQSMITNDPSCVIRCAASESCNGNDLIWKPWTFRKTDLVFFQ